MIILKLETEHYHFEACGETDTEARQALYMALKYHGEAADPPLKSNWWRDRYEISSLEIAPGECFRDGQLLYRK